MHGHSSPGGGFQGGVILASSFILMAVGIDLAEVKRRFPPLVLATFTSIGVLLYATIGMLSLVLGGNFLDYGVIPIPDARSVGMLGIEIGVGITVGLGCFTAFRKGDHDKLSGPILVEFSGWVATRVLSDPLEFIT